MAEVGNTITYTANVTPDVATAYAWSLSGGGSIIGSSTGPTLQVNWTSAGTHTINLTASNACSTFPTSIEQVVTSCTPITNVTITG